MKTESVPYTIKSVELPISIFFFGPIRPLNFIVDLVVRSATIVGLLVFVGYDSSADEGASPSRWSDPLGVLNLGHIENLSVYLVCVTAVLFPTMMFNRQALRLPAKFERGWHKSGSHVVFVAVTAAIASRYFMMPVLTTLGIYACFITCAMLLKFFEVAVAFALLSYVSGLLFLGNLAIHLYHMGTASESS